MKDACAFLTGLGLGLVIGVAAAVWLMVLAVGGDARWLR